MRFLTPVALAGLAVVPAVVAAQVRAARGRERRRAEFAAQALVLTGGTRRNRRLERLPFALFTLALVVLIIGAARPEASLGLPRRQGTVVLAFDTSNSMLATDLAPTRLQAAKAAAQAFVEEQPSEIRIGVVSFGDGAVVLQEPTLERADVLAAIERLNAGGGTSLGRGLYTALGAIAGKPLDVDLEQLGDEGTEVDIGWFGSAAVVLLSDGENTGPPDPIEVAKLASLAGATVHTVGLGDEAGTVLQIDGFSIATRLDVATLTALAEATGGTYSGAEDAEALREVYRDLDLEFVRDPEPTELTALFAAVGAALAVLAAGLSLAWFGRVM